MNLIKAIKDYRNHPVFTNISWQLFSKIMRSAIAILSVIVLTRYLGPEDFGFYSFVMAVVGIISRFSRGGADNVSIKEFSKHIEQKAEIFSSVLIWRSVCWGIGLAVLLILSAFTKDQRYIFAIVIYISLFFTSIDVIDNYFQSQLQNKYFIIARIAVEATSLLAKLYLAFIEAELSTFIYLITIQNVLYGLTILCVFRIKERNFPQLRFSRHKLVSIVKQSMPLIMAALMVTVFTYMDQIMLAYLAGDLAVGFYAPSSQIVMALFSFAIVCANPLQVKFASLDHKSDIYAQYLQYYFTIVTRVALAISIAVCFASPVIVRFLFGDEFLPTIPILMIQVWACVFVFQGQIREKEIINHHKSYYALIAVTIGAMSNFISNMLLIPIYEGVGAAIGTILSLFMAHFVTSWVIKDLRAMAKMQTKAFFIYKLPKLKEIQSG